VALKLSADGRGGPPQTAGDRAHALALGQAPRDLFALGERQVTRRAPPFRGPDAAPPHHVPRDRVLIAAQHGADLDRGVALEPPRPQHVDVVNRQPLVLPTHAPSGECRNLLHSPIETAATSASSLLPSESLTYPKPCRRLS